MEILKKLTRVRQVVPVIEGVVVQAAIHDDEIKYEVEWIDAVGDTHRRWFNQSELEELK